MTFVKLPAVILNLFSHSLIRFNDSFRPSDGAGEGAKLLNFEMFAVLLDIGRSEASEAFRRNVGTDLAVG